MCDHMLEFRYAVWGCAAGEALAVGFQEIRNASIAPPYPRRFPPVTGQNLEVFTKEIERTGFRGGPNRTRNVDRSWELTPF